VFWLKTWEWPDGHKLQPYGSGDFEPVCPVNGLGAWIPQGYGAAMIAGWEWSCSCGARNESCPKEVSDE